MSRYFSGLFKASEENHYDVEFVVKMFRNGELSALRDHMNQKRYSGILICGVSSADMEYLNEQEFDVPVVVNRPAINSAVSVRMLMRSVQSVHGCLQREDFGRPEF